MRQCATLLAIVIVLSLPATVAADGLIYQLPEDGAWARFEINGRGVAPDGSVAVTVEGAQTISSVGRATVEGEECRWIELKTEMAFQRAGAQAEKLNDVVKLLIPEKQLVRGKNPCDNVVKAYRVSSAETFRQLDPKGNDAREIQGMDEVFHAPLQEVSPLPVTEIKTALQTWACEGFKGETVSDRTIFKTETRTNTKAPFGVVTYKYEKERRRDNQSQGMRAMEWKLIELGTGAKSMAPDAQ